MASRKEQKAAARERLRQEMEQRKKRARRNRVIGVTAGVVVLIVAAVSIGIVLQKQRDSEAAAKAENKQGTPTRINDDGVSIRVGKADAPVTLTVYEDFRCPACGQFEKQFSPTIHALQKQGKLRTEYRLVTIIDDNLGGRGSHRAANAAACAKDAGRFRQYHEVLYRNQPPEQEDAFSSGQRLIKLAGKVDGLDDQRFRECVTGGEHNDWVKKTGAAFKRSGHQSTPTVLLDGESVYGRGEPLTPASLKEKVTAES